MSLTTPRDLVGVPLSGGLGNQMFQYAAALSVAERTGGRPYLDLRYFLRPDARPFELGAFGIEPSQWVPTLWRLEDAARAVSGGSWRPGPERVHESSEFEPQVLAVSAPCYLRGFFQSERYFESIAPLVRRRFDTTPLATARTRPYETQIAAATNPVIVHVRRGDYGNGSFPLLGRDHYDRARAELERRVADPTYFLFSDDPGAATEMLSDWPRVVSVPGLTALEDFRLMSLGRHYIIANSTFSWWAAWLGAAPDKVVVAPSLWYGPEFGRAIDLDVRLPRAWIRV